MDQNASAQSVHTILQLKKSISRLCLVMLARGTTSTAVLTNCNTTTAASQRQKSPAPSTAATTSSSDQKLSSSAACATRRFLLTKPWVVTRPATVRDLGAATNTPLPLPPTPTQPPRPPAYRTPLVGPTSVPSVTSPSPLAKPWADTNVVTTMAARRAE
ncbi:hypothetical protein CUMW_108440 [Citrus unshiu]|nr:hypothetical protein CUMW_108440 [Citrus unshiu]